MEGLLYLWLGTGFVGAILWPLMSFVIDVVEGEAKGWTLGTAMIYFANGLLLSTVVSVVIYLIARFYLWMEWLPKRR